MRLRTAVAIAALVLGTSFTSPAGDEDKEQPVKMNEPSSSSATVRGAVVA